MLALSAITIRHVNGNSAVRYRCRRRTLSSSVASSSYTGTTISTCGRASAGSRRRAHGHGARARRRATQPVRRGVVDEGTASSRRKRCRGSVMRTPSARTVRTGSEHAGRSLRARAQGTPRVVPARSRTARRSSPHVNDLAPAARSPPRPYPRARAPRHPSRARRAARARRRPLPLGARPQRLRQRVLQRRRARDEHELARLPLWILRHRRSDDGRQAAARAVGPGAVRARVRVQLMEHPRAAGADGRGDGRPDLRPHPPPLRPRGRLRGRPGARAHARHRRHRAPQQPRRAARALLHRRALVPRQGARGRAHALARPRRRRGRARLRGQDGGRAARGARASRPRGSGRRRATASRGCWPAARR